MDFLISGWWGVFETMIKAFVVEDNSDGTRLDNAGWGWGSMNICSRSINMIGWDARLGLGKIVG